MCSTVLRVLALATVAVVTLAATNCVHFQTNGSTGAVFDYYRFYDFRTLAKTADDAAPSAPALSRFKTFSTVPWRAGWSIRTWYRPAAKAQNVDMYYTSSEVFIANETDSSQHSSSYITLRTKRLANDTQLAVELNYLEYNVTFASIRMLARVRGSGGAVAGLFTYHNDTIESDIEFLTKGPPTQVQYSNQPTTDLITDKPIAGSTFNVSLPSGQVMSRWNVHRLDWVRGRSAWFVNGFQTAATEVNVPDVASMVILNLWSNGGNFSGLMRPGEEAYFDLQWVELLFNATTSIDNPIGGTLCSAESSLGSPTPVQRNGCSSSHGKTCGGHCWWFKVIISATAFYFLL